MKRNILRLTALIFALSTTFVITTPRLADAATCGTGAFFVTCSKMCCGVDVTTHLTAHASASTCPQAKLACTQCLAACPAGQSQCGTTTVGLCAT